MTQNLWWAAQGLKQRCPKVSWLGDLDFAPLADPNTLRLRAYECRSHQKNRGKSDAGT